MGLNSGIENFQVKIKDIVAHDDVGIHLMKSRYE